MLSIRLIRSGMLSTGLLTVFGVALSAAEHGFTDPATLAEPAAASPIVSRIDELDRVADERVTNARPQPRERPRLTQGELLSEAGRLRVHGGISVTVGGGSGGSFHGSSAWVSYYDPVTGLGLSIAISQMSGGSLYGYPGYDYHYPRFAAPVYPSPVPPHLRPDGER